MKIYLDAGAIMPTRAHEEDAGFDLYAREGKEVPAHGSATFDTGVHLEIPRFCGGLLVSKSGLNVKHDLTSTGLVDALYQGSIVVKLYNDGNEPYMVQAGDKISQIVILPIKSPGLELVNDLGSFMQSERGSNGFGSTGK